MADGDDDTRLRSGRPTIGVGGQDDADLEAGLLGLSVVETAQGLYRCEAVFGNWGGDDFRYFDRRKLDFGKPFSVKIGADVIFDGKITALEAHFPYGKPPEIAVLAEDRFQDLRMTRRSRAFEDVSDADVIRRIASDHGLRPSVDVQGPTHKVLAQVNQSDLAFLRDRARAVGAELWMEGDALHAAPRSSRGRASVELKPGGALRELSILADLAAQRTSVTVGGWDVSRKEAISREATDAILQGELGSDESGASVLRAALGRRKEAIAHGVPLTGEEAQRRAEAHMRAIARRFVVARGVAEPDGRLRVGATAELQDVGPLFNGRYYVSEVRHLFDGTHGLRTEFSAERPGLGRP
jgi:uncharacterized protein